MTQSKNFFLTLLVAGSGIAGAAAPVYDFAAITPERFKECTSYGDDCAIALEDGALTARFSNKTPIDWCNQGFGIVFAEPFGWNDFDVIELDYRRTPPINAIGMLLHDAAGNWFFTFKARDLNREERNREYFARDDFHFSYNDDPAIREAVPGEHPLRNMIVYLTTAEINTGRNYEFQVDRVAFQALAAAPARTLNPDAAAAAGFGEAGKPDQLLSGSVAVERADEAFSIRFDDSAPDSEWFHKGVKVTLPEPVSWDDFNFLSFDYRMEPGFVTVGVYVRDANQVWHEAFQSRDLVTGKWANVIFEKEAFHTGEFNRTPDLPPEAKSSAPIEEVFLYFGNIEANRGRSYQVAVRNLTFSGNLPGYDYRYEINDDYANQWRNDRINAKGFPVVDGKPFFPLLLYSCIGIDRASGTAPISLYTGEFDDAINRRRFREVRDAGFNALMTYTLNLYGQPVPPNWNGDRGAFPGEDGETTEELYREGARRFLDYCRDAGLQAMVGAYSTYSIPKALPLIGKKLRWEEQKERLKRNIEGLKAHPALLCWYMIDEPSSISLPERDLAQTYQYMKELDTGHPFLMAAADPRHDLKYFRGVDVVAPDSYPLAFGKPILTDWDNLDIYGRQQQGNPGYPLLWQIVQICQWLEGKELPSAQLIRLQALLALTREVKGLCFYEHKNYPIREPEQWVEISRAVNSLARLTPAILDAEGVGSDYTADQPALKTILYRGSGFDLLIAANPTAETLEAEFTFANGVPAKIIAVDENAGGEFTPDSERDIQPGPRGFRDRIPGMTGRAYRIHHADSNL